MDGSARGGGAAGPGGDSRHTALRHVCDRWTVLIFSALEIEDARFSELRRAIPDISQKMLAQTLRTLERDGLVDRAVHAEVPVRVVYSLTSSGGTVAAPLRALRLWAEEHSCEAAMAQNVYDATRSADGG